MKYYLPFILVLTSACATVDFDKARFTGQELEVEDTEVKELAIVDEYDLENAKNVPLKYQFDEEDLDSQQKIENIPVEVNVAVEKWIDYFTGRGRHHMDRYLARSSRYIPLMKSILKKQGLPEDLVYIALIESGFNATAYSHASAVGYWQFIRGTGLRYGLRIDGMVDERRDFILATQAAGAYMKDLYNMFGEWYLAIASYNVGENRIKRLVRTHNTKDFWQLARMRKLPKETINYVPKYIAAKLIAKNPAKYGITNIEYQAPLAFEELEVNENLNLETFAKELGLEYADMSKLNPMYRTKYASPNKAGVAVVKIPLNTKERALAIVANHFEKDPRVIASVQLPEFIRYRVRNGDTLGSIARKFRTRVSTIREINNIRGTQIRAGAFLRVPSREGVRGSAIMQSKNLKKAHSSKPIIHRVKNGENLHLIARKYQVSVSEIQLANRIKGTKLFVGANLKIPGEVRSSSGVTKHIVKPGDTLLDIAKKYNISMSQIAKANNLSKKAYIQVGKALVIPQ